MTEILSILLLPLYIYTLISTILVLLMENRNAAKSLAWVMVLIFLPLFGLILYLLVGQDHRKIKIISKKSIRRVNNRPVANLDLEEIKTKGLTDSQLKLVKLLYHNNDSLGYASNKIEVLADGETTFNSLFEAIRNAKKHIHIQFFIFGDDRISNQLRELLIQKAQEGVRVRMIYDYWGSFDLSKKYLKTLRESGAFVRSFLPLRLRFSRSKINYRNHRKMVIVDGKIGFTGGLNVADRYIYGNTLGTWRDTFIRMEGAVVHGLQLSFLVDWYFVERKFIQGSSYFPKPEKFDNDNLIQIVTGGPDSDWKAILQGISYAMVNATKYIYIHTPYYIPPSVLENCIQIAALSGIDVRLLIPVKSDSALSDASTRTYFGRAMEAGVRIYQYNKGFLHSKAIVIDDFISIVGSCNLDERSFGQNFEANAFIYESKTALQLKELFLQDIKGCEELSLEGWRKRKKFQKFKESLARLFSPIL